MSLVAACYGLARFAYGLFVPAFRDAFDLSSATAGTIASGSYVAYCLGIIAATVATPKFGARAVCLSAGTLAASGMALIAAAPTSGVLAAGVIIAGSSTGVASPPLAHAIAHVVAKQLRDRTQTIVNAGTGLGVAVSGPVALIAQEHWRIAWMAFSVLAAAVTVWVAFTVPSGRTVNPTDEQSSPFATRWLPPGVIALVSAGLIMGGASAATWTFGQDLLVTAGEHDQQSSTVAWIALGVCGLAGAFSGDLIDRLKLRPSWSIVLLMLAASTAALAAVPGNFAVAIVAIGVFGAGYIAATGVLLVWATRIFRSPARGVGLAFLSIALGQALASSALGLIIDQSSPTVAFWCAAVLAATGVFIKSPSASDDAGTSTRDGTRDVDDTGL